jgi:hypothetical protein
VEVSQCPGETGSGVTLVRVLGPVDKGTDQNPVRSLAAAARNGLARGLGAESDHPGGDTGPTGWGTGRVISGHISTIDNVCSFPSFYCTRSFVFWQLRPCPDCKPSARKSQQNGQRQTQCQLLRCDPNTRRLFLLAQVLPSTACERWRPQERERSCDPHEDYCPTVTRLYTIPGGPPKEKSRFPAAS